MDLQLCIVGSVILQSYETYLYTHFYMPLFYLQVQHLIAELNEILAHETVDEGGLWKKKLTDQSFKLFEFLPQAIQEQLMLERDPHGNVQVPNVSKHYLPCLFVSFMQLESISLLTLVYLHPGCQNRNRENAYRNG